MSCAMSIVRTIRILGIDPGLRVTGFGVIDKAGLKRIIDDGTGHSSTTRLYAPRRFTR